MMSFEAPPQPADTTPRQREVYRYPPNCWGPGLQLADGETSVPAVTVDESIWGLGVRVPDTEHEFDPGQILTATNGEFSRLVEVVFVQPDERGVRVGLHFPENSKFWPVS